MSGVVKAIKKVFKAVVKVVKKIAKPLLIAAAVYFTAGLALSAFPATAGFAASMPGFAGGGLLGGGAAGTGIFTKIAAKLGLSTLGSSGGLIGGALAKGTTVAALQSAGIGASALAAGATKAAASGLISSAAGGAGVAGTVVNAAGIAAPATAADIGWTGAAAGSAGAGASGAVAAKAGMTLTEKLLLAQAGTKVIGAFIAPTENQIQEAQKKFRGAFYGAEANAAPPPPSQGMQGPGPAVNPATPQRQLLGQPSQPLPTMAPQPASQQTLQQQTAQNRQTLGGRSLLPTDDALDEPFKYGALA
jgi:hypothetical protein